MRSMNYVFAVDFETYYDDNCNIKRLGLEGYLQDDKFDAYLVSIVGNNGFEWIGHPSEFDWSYLEGAQLVSHNAEFDESVYYRGVEKGLWPPIMITAWICTANMCTSLGLPRSLKGAMSKVFGVKVSKKVRSDMKGVMYSKLTQVEKDKVKEYCLEDSRQCLSLLLELVP